MSSKGDDAVSIAETIASVTLKLSPASHVLRLPLSTGGGQCSTCRRAYERVGLTAQLLQQAGLSVNLAQGRYDLGLGSIVELSQAQLNLTSAQIANAAARYDYQAQRVAVDYQLGLLH